MHPPWTDKTNTKDEAISDSFKPGESNNLAFLSRLRVLQLQGIGAAEFLQGYLSCDTRKLSSENPLFGAICDIKGRVIASFYLLEIQGFPTLLTHCDTLGTVREHLKKYLVFSKCELMDISNDFVILGRIRTSPAGPHSRKLHLSIEPGVSEMSLDKDSERQILVCKPEKALEIWSTGDAHIGEHIWQLADLYSGIILPDSQNTGMHLPQSLNMTAANEAVDFNKGCYLGQEIIARVEHRGNVKRHLGIYSWRSNTDATPKFGDDIIDSSGKTLGQVSQCVEISTEEGLLAGVVRLIDTNDPTESYRVGEANLFPIKYQS